MEWAHFIRRVNTSRRLTPPLPVERAKSERSTGPKRDQVLSPLLFYALQLAYFKTCTLCRRRRRLCASIKCFLCAPMFTLAEFTLKRFARMKLANKPTNKRDAQATGFRRAKQQTIATNAKSSSYLLLLQSSIWRAIWQIAIPQNSNKRS